MKEEEDGERSVFVPFSLLLSYTHRHHDDADDDAGDVSLCQ